MDSTKSNFNITTLTVPIAQFRHCWIWNPESFWIIGGYYPSDSTGADLGLNNILSYENGNWSNTAAYYRGDQITETSRFWAFSKNNVWFSMYNIVHWTGETGESIYHGPKTKKLYGFDTNEIYAASIDSLFKITGEELSLIHI